MVMMQVTVYCMQVLPFSQLSSLKAQHRFNETENKLYRYENENSQRS